MRMNPLVTTVIATSVITDISKHELYQLLPGLKKLNIGVNSNVLMPDGTYSIGIQFPMNSRTTDKLSNLLASIDCK